MTNPLDAYPQVRKILYLLQWLTTGATGVLGVVFAAQDDVPSWYTITVAVLAFVWTYTGLTAQGNVDTGPPDERGEGALGVVLAVLAIVVLVLLVLRLT